MKTSHPSLINQERTLWAYELVDNQLQKCLKENECKLDFAFRTLVGMEAIKILKDHALVSFNTSFLPGAMLSLTEKGKDVIAAGGIQEYLKFWKIDTINILH